MVLMVKKSLTAISVSIFLLLGGCNIELGQEDSNSSSASTPDAAFARYNLSTGAFIGCIEITGNNVVSYDASLVEDGKGTIAQNGISTDATYTSGTKSGRTFKVNHRVIFDNGDRFTVVSESGSVLSGQYRKKVSNCSGVSTNSVTIPKVYMAAYSQTDSTYKICLERDVPAGTVIKYYANGTSISGNVTTYPETSSVVYSDGSSFTVTRTSDFVDGVWKMDVNNQGTGVTTKQYRTTVTSCSTTPPATITVPTGL